MTSFSKTTSHGAVGQNLALAQPLDVGETRMTPWESWPTRLASTRWVAMRSASGGLAAGGAEDGRGQFDQSVVSHLHGLSRLLASGVASAPRAYHGALTRPRSPGLKP